MSYNRIFFWKISELISKEKTEFVISDSLNIFIDIILKMKEKYINETKLIQNLIKRE